MTYTKLPAIDENSIRSVDIIAKKWRQPNTSKSFHSVKIWITLKHHSKPIELISVPYAQGRDRSYDQTALQQWLKFFPQKTKNQYLSRYLEERGIMTNITKQDVVFKKDLEI